MNWWTSLWAKDLSGGWGYGTTDDERFEASRKMVMEAGHVWECTCRIGDVGYVKINGQWYITKYYTTTNQMLFTKCTEPVNVTDVVYYSRDQ